MIMRAFFEEMTLADGVRKALLDWQGECDKRESTRLPPVDGY